MPFPVSSLPSRAPRVRTTEYTPAVLRFPSGDTVTGRLEVFSATGGLLCLPKPLIRGTRIRVMFLTPKGPVLGAAEMLTPVSWTQQPFRFVTPADQGSAQTAGHQRALSETGHSRLRSQAFRYPTQNRSGLTNTGLRSAATRHAGRCWKECWKHSGCGRNSSVKDGVVAQF